MNDDASRALPERPAYLVLLATAPAIWMLHFLLSYVTAAVWCARYAGPGGSLDGARLAIGAYTLVALVFIGLIGRGGRRRHRHGTETLPHDSDTPEDRHRFLGFATLLLAGLSALATVYVALAAAFIGTCH